jgi:hypothetical protein
MDKVYSKVDNKIFKITGNKKLPINGTILHVFKDGWELNKIILNNINKKQEKLICNEQSGTLLKYIGYNDKTNEPICENDILLVRYEYYHKEMFDRCVVVKENNQYTLEPNHFKQFEHPFVKENLINMKIESNKLIVD